MRVVGAGRLGFVVAAAVVGGVFLSPVCERESCCCC